MVFNSRKKAFSSKISRKLDSIFAGARDEANHRNRLEKPEGGPFARASACILKRDALIIHCWALSFVCVYHIESESNGGLSKK